VPIISDKYQQTASRQHQHHIAIASPVTRHQQDTHQDRAYKVSYRQTGQSISSIAASASLSAASRIAHQQQQSIYQYIAYTYATHRTRKPTSIRIARIASPHRVYRIAFIMASRDKYRHHHRIISARHRARINNQHRYIRADKMQHIAIASHARAASQHIARTERPGQNRIRETRIAYQHRHIQSISSHIYSDTHKYRIKPQAIYRTLSRAYRTHKHASHREPQITTASRQLSPHRHRHRYHVTQQASRISTRIAHRASASHRTSRYFQTSITARIGERQMIALPTRQSTYR
jgi:hypothetical protein